MTKAERDQMRIYAADRGVTGSMCGLHPEWLLSLLDAADERDRLAVNLARSRHFLGTKVQRLGRYLRDAKREARELRKELRKALRQTSGRGPT